MRCGRYSRLHAAAAKITQTSFRGGSLILASSTPQGCAVDMPAGRLKILLLFPSGNDLGYDFWKALPHYRQKLKIVW
jgi:hypothetical protein